MCAFPQRVRKVLSFEMTILHKKHGKGRSDYVRVIPPIPFEKPTKKTLTKEQYHAYKLRSSPTSNDSPTCDLVVPYFSAGTCEEFLTFMENFDRVSTGQNLTSGANEFALARRLLKGEALAVFENAAKDLDENSDNLKAGFKAIAKVIFPPKAALTQKRCMQRFLREPKGMKIYEFMARLCEINNLLPKFPEMGVPPLNTKLPDDEIKEIAEHCLSYKLQRQMHLQGFEVCEKTTQEFIATVARLEEIVPEENEDVSKQDET